MIRYLFTFLAIGTLYGCNNEQDRTIRFLNFVRNDNQNTKTEQQTEAVMLVKEGSIPMDAIGIIFGYVDNLGTCKMIADAFNEKSVNMKLGCHRTGEFSQK